MSQAPMPEEMNVYQNAEARFEVAANKLGLEQGLYRFLKWPSKEITLYIPVGMDNGQLEVFTGYRVLHSNVRGPGKGGIRFAPDVSLDEDRKSTRLNSSHGYISYAVFCLKKKKYKNTTLIALS